jgi:hypothetical protein
MESRIKNFLYALCVGIPLLIALQGCTMKAMNCNDVMGRETIWKSGNHAWFSVYGYKSLDGQDIKNSDKEGWNGCETNLP